MTTDELRVMIEKLIDRRLTDSLAGRTSERTISRQMRERALSAVGRFHSGHADVSASHDDHLAASLLE
jgi:hypothetical protein